jgi:hypothetical protein
MQRYTEADFERVEAQATKWRQLLESEVWKELDRDRKIMIRAWEKAMRIQDGDVTVRTQGMIAGAEVVMGYAEDRVTDIESVLEAMQDHNKQMDAQEVEDDAA